MSLKRKTPLRSRSPIKQGGTPIKTVNPEQRAKRKKRQASKHAAYMKSQTRLDVDYRANGRCEAAVRMEPGLFEVQAPDFLGVVSPTAWFAITHKSENWQRCPNSSNLQHHHLTYARYGGDELPEDILKCCKRCHDWLESQHPTRRGRT